LTATMPVVVDWGDGVFADCLLWVQLFVSTCNGRPHFWPKISGRRGRPPPTILLLRKLS